MIRIKFILFIFYVCSINIFCVGNNNPPDIENIIAIPDSIIIGGTVLLICNAIDEEDKKSLNYVWDCTSGNISAINNKDSANWIAPEETGYYSISCEVSDNNNGSTIKTISIEVF